MSYDTSGFTARLRAVLGISRTAPLVLLGNFEVERRWARGEPGLPQFHAPASDMVVNRMDEFALTLAGPDDVVVLKRKPDEDYLEYLIALGWRRPRLVVPVTSDPARDVTHDVLADSTALSELASLAAEGAKLYPHGASLLEEQLAQACGLPLATPGAELCKAVNSKVYSRKLTERLGLRQPEGRWCENLDDWAEAVRWARSALATGARVAVKDAFGVSGKGILFVESEQRLARLGRQFASRAVRRGDERLGVVVEKWVAKSADLNYQFTISRDGGVHLDFVKEALTERGVHKGHLFPPRISSAVREEIGVAATRVGTALAADGYHGVVGVDAMIDPDGALYPVIEINARNNMSTYQQTLLEQCGGPETAALARFWPLSPGARTRFDELRELVGDLMFTAGGQGLLINNFATVGAAGPDSNAGRLYGLVIAKDLDTVRAIDSAVTERLSAEWGTSAA